MGRASRPRWDRTDSVTPPTSLAIFPIEQAESEYPVHIERYGYVTDSGGAGKFRGGLGLEREWRLLSGEAHLAIRSDRRDHLPYGLYGGQPGRGSINVLHHTDGEEEVLQTMISTSMEADERIYHRQAGGGGWGDPLLRSPADVARDVKNNKVSLEAAREAYGVVLDEVSLAVDKAATAALRGQTHADKRKAAP